MLEALFKTLLAVIMLVIIVPLVMLLFGEGALAYKVFGWAFPKSDKQEIVVQRNTSNNDNTATFRQTSSRNTRQTATVKHVYVDHNTHKDNEKGMTITVEFESKNLKGEDLYCLVRFYNDDGSPLVQKNYNEKYLSINGNVIVGQYTSPPYNDCSTKTTLFIPYNELPHSKNERTDYLLDASILHYHTETEYDVLDRSNSYSFYLLNEP